MNHPDPLSGPEILDEASAQVHYVYDIYDKPFFVLQNDRVEWWPKLGSSFTDWMAAENARGDRPVPASPLTNEISRFLENVSTRRPTEKESALQTLRRVQELLAATRRVTEYLLEHSHYRCLPVSNPQFAMRRMDAADKDAVLHIAAQMPHITSYERTLLRNEKETYLTRVIHMPRSGMPRNIVGFCRFEETAREEDQKEHLSHVERRIAAVGCCDGVLIPEAVAACVLEAADNPLQIRRRDNYAAYNRVLCAWRGVNC